MGAIAGFVWIDRDERRRLRAIPVRRTIQMRVIDCPCGHRLQADDDEELVRLAREHMDSHHPDMPRTDEQIRQRVARDARNA
jgi:predicted small metal-binding protein